MFVCLSRCSIVDNLPCVTRHRGEDGAEAIEMGYRLGRMVGEQAFIYNHLDFLLQYHTEDE